MMCVLKKRHENIMECRIERIAIQLQQERETEQMNVRQQQRVLMVKMTV